MFLSRSLCICAAQLMLALLSVRERSIQCFQVNLLHALHRTGPNVWAEAAAEGAA
jgi:hypothetical protein